jgi:hypothetical protein
MRDAEILSDSDDVVSDGRLLHRNDRSPADIERQVLALSISSSVEELCSAFDACDWLLARVRAIDHLRKEFGIAWIEHNGEFDFGDAHYSVGYSISVRCVSVPQAGHAVLAAAGGDFDEFLRVLVAQPFKHASVRSIIGKQLHDRLFRAHRAGRIINGVPERTLKRTDNRFGLPTADTGK